MNELVIFYSQAYFYENPFCGCCCCCSCGCSSSTGGGSKPKPQPQPQPEKKCKCSNLCDPGDVCYFCSND